MKSRIAWLGGFALIVAPILGVLFSSQIWATAHGFLGERSVAEFKVYGAPLWGYVVPAPGGALSDLLPADPYKVMPIFAAGERTSYLGIVTLFLLNVAAFRRKGLKRAGFFWTLFLLLMLLSLGPRMAIGSAVRLARRLALEDFSALPLDPSDRALQPLCVFDRRRSRRRRV